MERAFLALKLPGLVACRTVGKVGFRQGSDALKVVVAGLAEMRGPKAEINGDGAAVTTLERVKMSWMTI